MLSRQLFDEFLAPYYRRITPFLREHGVYVIVDTDGDVTEMVPWLADVGVHGVLPLERQAGVDGARIRALRGDFRLVGHFDKMTMNRGEAGMRAEFERLLPLMRSGGFIPSVDHQTPPHVSLEEYRLYLRLLDEYTAAV
jgi:uroporphyrinogen-III decarboxylase